MRNGGRGTARFLLVALVVGSWVSTSTTVLAAPPSGKGPAVSWSPGVLDITVPRGTSTSASVIFTSATSLTSVSAVVGGGVPAFVTPAPATLPSVAAATPVALSLGVTVPAATSIGLYVGSIQVRASGKNIAKPLPITLRVVANTNTNTVAAVTAGATVTCALMSAGTVFCWGNQQRQVSPGVTTSTASPVAVDISGLGTVVSIDSAHGGTSGTCALTSGGVVACWKDSGNNLVPQVVGGIGIPPTPNDPFQPRTAAAMSHGGGGGGGSSNLCVVSTLAEVFCSPFPRAPLIASGAMAVTSGGAHACALVTGGGVKCWGSNAAGQLGNGTTIDSATPVDVVGLGSGVVAVSGGGAHTCALLGTGGVKCWGDNSFGALGGASATISAVPIDVSGLSAGVAAISAGGNHTCAVLTTGGAKCWGHNANGQLGNGTFTNASVPGDVAGLTAGVTSISSGGAHTCAIVGGGAKCWGHSVFGELGGGVFGTEPGVATPGDVVFAP